MIFNITSGGVAYISVTGPSGCRITATQGALSFARDDSGNITVPALGTWDVVCSYGGVNSQTKQATVDAFGATSNNVSFMSDYTATIRVTTHPGAICSATLGSLTIPNTAANSNGVCDLTVPAGGLGTWSVKADNGVVYDTKSAYVGSYGSTTTIPILTNIPVIVMSINNVSYTYKGATINDSNVTVYQSGNGWKMWLRTSATIKFTYLSTTVGIFCVGQGGQGGLYTHPSNNTDKGGSGGNGGGIVTYNNQSLSVNTNYQVTIGEYSQFGSYGAATRGSGASGGGGAQSVDTGWNGISYSGRGSGSSGQYAFGDSSFDGVEYGHGGMGGDVGYGTGKRGDTTGVYANPGAGGAGGGGNNNNPTAGNVGIVILRG